MNNNSGLSGDDGGPAFPCEIEVPAEYDGHNNSKAMQKVNGMTLRDYFAAKALQGILADGFTLGREEYEAVSAVAYGHADAMLKARLAPANTPNTSYAQSKQE